MNTLYRRVHASFHQQGFLKLLDAQLGIVEPGQVSISCRLRPELAQQQGFLHGGVVSSIADVTCGYAALTVIPEGQEVLTVEFKINFLRPVSGEKIIAVGTVLKAGKSLIVTEAKVTDAESKKLVALMLATMAPVSLTGMEKLDKGVDRENDAEG